jgi:hypothetical protein
MSWKDFQFGEPEDLGRDFEFVLLNSSLEDSLHGRQFFWTWDKSMTASSSWHCTKQKPGTDEYAAYFPATSYRNAIDMGVLSDHADWH